MKVKTQLADIHQVHQVSQQGHLIDLYIVLLAVFRARITDISQRAKLDSCEILTMIVIFDSREANSFYQRVLTTTRFSVSRKRPTTPLSRLLKMPHLLCTTNWVILSRPKQQRNIPSLSGKSYPMHSSIAGSKALPYHLNALLWISSRVK